MKTIARMLPFLALASGLGCLDAFKTKEVAVPISKDEPKPAIKELKPSPPPSARKVEPLHTDYLTPQNAHDMADRMGEELNRDKRVVDGK